MRRMLLVGNWWSLVLLWGLAGALSAQPGLQQVAPTVWWDPEPLVVEGPWESHGFGGAMVEWGGGLVIGSPRSNRDGERAGALWFAGGDRARLREMAKGIVQPAQVLGSALAVGTELGLLAAGAPLAPGVGLDPGWVYLFDSSGARGEPLATLVPARSQHADGFGSALAFDSTGLWVAAPFGHSGGQRVGYVARFESVGGSWREVARLYGPAGEDLPRFGEALIARDGDVLVSAPWAGPAGRVYRYKGEGDLLGLDSVLRAPVALGEGAQFGADLALDDSGEWLFVGAPLALGQGRVQVYEKDSGGGFGSGRFERGAILAPPIEFDLGRFGMELDTRGDWLWVGAPEGRGAVCGLGRPWHWPQLAAVWPGDDRDDGFGAALLARDSGALAAAPGRGIVMFDPPSRERLALVKKPAAGHGSMPSGWGGANSGMRWFVRDRDLAWLGFGLPAGLTGSWRLEARPKSALGRKGSPTNREARESGGSGEFRVNSAGELRIRWNTGGEPWPGGWLRLRSPGLSTVQIRIPAG